MANTKLELLTEFQAMYLRPFYDQSPTFDREDSKWFSENERYFDTNPDRKSFIRKSHGAEFSPCWDALFVNAFGLQTLNGVDWKFLELFKREPLRLVLVTRINATNHMRKVFYLGRADGLTLERDWVISDFIKCATDSDVQALVKTLLERLPAEHDYCDAWLEELFEALRNDPVWQMRQVLRSLSANSLVQ